MIISHHHPDAIIGAKIRERRRSLGLTQTNVASAIGVTPQQVQKYELGTNRVASSTLIKICKFLDVKIEDFFGSLISTSSMAAEGDGDHSDAQNTLENNINTKFSDNSILQTSREMMDVFSKIRDPKLREDLLRLARSMTESQPREE